MSWIITLLAGWYVAWTGYSLAGRVPAFARLFTGLGADLPWPTRAVVTACTPAIIWPLTLATLAALVIKEMKLQNIRTKLLISTITFMATACIAAVVTEALYQPMFHLIEQIR